MEEGDALVARPVGVGAVEPGEEAVDLHALLEVDDRLGAGAHDVRDDAAQRREVAYVGPVGAPLQHHGTSVGGLDTPGSFLAGYSPSEVNASLKVFEGRITAAVFSGSGRK